MTKQGKGADAHPKRHDTELLGVPYSGVKLVILNIGEYRCILMIPIKGTLDFGRNMELLEFSLCFSFFGGVSYGSVGGISWQWMHPRPEMRSPVYECSGEE